MADQIYLPGVGGAPFGNALFANPEGSTYAATSAFSPSTTDLLYKALSEKLFDAAPAQYNVLKLLFEQPFETENSDQFYYREFTFGRAPLTITANAAGAAASPGNIVTANYVVSAASLTNISRDMVVAFYDNTKGVVTNISGTTLTISSQTSVGLPAITAATAAQAVLVPMSTLRADGQSNFSTFQRLLTIERYNYVQWFLRVKRWGRVELQNFINNGTTDYLEKDSEELMKRIRYDMFSSFVNGTRGESVLATGEPAKMMGGIYPTMIAAGSASTSTTTSGLQAAFETLAFATNYKNEGGVRFILTPPRIKHELDKIYKQPGLRYTPNDKIANLQLDLYEYGDMKFVPLSTQLLQEPSLFTADFANRMMVIDMNSIKPVIMKGMPAMDMGTTLGLENRGTREAFHDMWVEAQLSLKFNNPPGSFIINVS